MTHFKKTTAVVLAILFIITAAMAILLVNFDQYAFSAETYQQAFAREDFYNQIPRLMAQSITSGTDPAQQPLGMQNLSTETWEDFMRTLLPPDVLKPIGDELLNSTFAYLNLQSDSIQIDLVPIKDNMLGETGTQAAMSLLNALPACTLDQSAMIMFGMFTGDQIQLCNPPESVLPMLMPLIQAQMQAATFIIPDELTLVIAPTQNDPRERIQTARLFMRLSLILPIGFLLALSMVAVRSLKDGLNWWGPSLLMTGFVIFVIGMFGAPVFGVLLEKILSSQLPNFLPAFLLDFTGEFASAMVRALLNPVQWQGLILTGLGTGMAGMGYFLNRTTA